MINYLLAFIALLFGSVVDLKTREVPDWLNFSMIAAGIGFGVISAFFFRDPWFFYSSLIGLAVGFVVAMFFYKAGQWGGGDAKALMGLGALIGVDFRFGLPLFFILILNIMIVGAVYGMIWSVVLAIKNWYFFKDEFKKLIYNKRNVKLRTYVLLLSLLGVAGFFTLPILWKPLSLGIAGFVFFVFYFYLYSKAVEKSSMERKIKVKYLTEGDWVVENVFVDKKVKDSPYQYFMRKYKLKLKEDTLTHLFMIFGLKKSFVKRDKKIYKQTHSGWDKYYNKIVERAADFHLKGKASYNKDKEVKEKIHEVFLLSAMPKKRNTLLTSVKKFLEKEGFYYDKDLIVGPDNREGVYKHHIAMLKHHNIEEVKIKEGIPFLPSFLIAFVLMWWLGNWFVYLI